jgi:hypothetical protein
MNSGTRLPMARKKKAVDRKDTRVEFMATAEWVEMFRAEAERLGTDLSSYIRMACNEKRINDQRRFGTADDK